MSVITNEWKSLKPAIGNFLSKVDSLYNQADDIEHVKETRYKKGYKKGYEVGFNYAKNNDICDGCKTKEFYNKLKNSELRIVEDAFNALKEKQRDAIIDLICTLADAEDEE